MGRTGSARVRAHAAKAHGVRFGIGLAATTLLAAVASTPPAKADPVVCATVYYTINAGTPNYIVDKCYIPSPWTQQFGEHDCTTLGTTAQVCRQEGLSFPVP